MMNVKLVVFAAVVTVCYGQAFTQNCPNLFEDFKKCASGSISSILSFGDHGSDLSSVLNVGSLMKDQYSNMCENRELVDEFYNCVFDKVRSCIPSEWQKTFPDSNGIRDSLKVICKNINDIDLSCLTTNTQKLVSCVTAGMTKVQRADTSSVDGYLTMVCSAQAVSENCYRSVLAVCPGKTAEVMTEVAKYQKPVGCDASVSLLSKTLLIISLVVTCFKKMI